jgi:DNA-binding SARP family transcriptional activator
VEPVATQLINLYLRQKDHRAARRAYTELTRQLAALGRQPTAALTTAALTTAALTTAALTTALRGQLTHPS